MCFPASGVRDVYDCFLWVLIGSLYKEWVSLDCRRVIGLHYFSAMIGSKKKNSCHSSIQSGVKSRPIVTQSHMFSRAFCKLHDWFDRLFLDKMHLVNHSWSFFRFDASTLTCILHMNAISCKARVLSAYCVILVWSIKFWIWRENKEFLEAQAPTNNSNCQIHVTWGKKHLGFLTLESCASATQELFNCVPLSLLDQCIRFTSGLRLNNTLSC